jgi:pyrrolidone-carboxylate peptidase
MASTLGENVQVVACNLPVVYDRAAWAAKDCVQNFHPDVVISFGEGACDLRIETAATNQDDAWLPDNAGELRSGSPIVSGGPARSTFEFPVQAMFCALEPDYSQVAVSTDPGAFVCNNTAYHLSQDLAAKGIPFTFIHVPNSQCEPQDRNVQKNTQIIAQMLRGAIANLRQPIRPDAPWPHPGTPVKMPATKSEAEALVNLLQARRAPVCEQNFARAIVRASIVD